MQISIILFPKDKRSGLHMGINIFSATKNNVSASVEQATVGQTRAAIGLRI
jgi:hypothetical protein